MKKESLGHIFILLRYLLLVVLGMSLFLFYEIFTPLTIYPVYWISSLIFNDVNLSGNLLFFSGKSAEIIPSCVGGAAYYLLSILNLTTPMKIAKRIKSLIFMFGTFLFFNIIRILVFLWLFAASAVYFDYAHRFVWYFGSTILVVVIWFLNAALFKIKEIPIFTDVRKYIFMSKENFTINRKINKPKDS